MGVLIKVLLALVKPLSTLLALFLAKNAGKKEAVAEVVKKTLDTERKNNAVEESNLAKSDADILNELRDKDTRGTP
jgi:hypothetical protein